jgi:hypothetical protein
MEEERQEEDRLSRAGLVRGSDGSLRPLAVALEREPGLAYHVQAIQDRIDARRAADADVKEKAERDRGALAAEQEIKDTREQARVSAEPEPEDIFAAMVDRIDA